MAESIFLAGASGAIGCRLGPLLVAEGWRVTGTTRSAAKAAMLRGLGVDPVVVDVFDAASLQAAVAAAQPDIVIHQLTDLPPGLDPALMADALARNARIRDEGTRNLVAASVQSGARRFIAQSIAFAYDGDRLPHREEDSFARGSGISARGVASLEQQVLEAPFAGIVLRYGRLYGPGTGFDTPTGAALLHVDDAAMAAVRAVSHGAPGIYNIAEDDGTVATDKARQQLGWVAGWRMPA